MHEFVRYVDGICETNQCDKDIEDDEDGEPTQSDDLLFGRIPCAWPPSSECDLQSVAIARTTENQLKVAQVAILGGEKPPSHHFGVLIELGSKR